MATSDSGLKALTWADFEAGISVGGGGNFLTTAAVNLLDGTSSLIPDTVMFNFLLTAFTTSYDFEVYAVFSEDGTKFPDVTNLEQCKRIMVAPIQGNTATDMQTNVYETPILAQYIKLFYANKDGSNSITLTTRYASSFQASYSA